MVHTVSLCLNLFTFLFQVSWWILRHVREQTHCVSSICFHLDTIICSNALGTSIPKCKKQWRAFNALWKLWLYGIKQFVTSRPPLIEIDTWSGVLETDLFSGDRTDTEDNSLLVSIRLSTIVPVLSLFFLPSTVLARHPPNLSARSPLPVCHSAQYPHNHLS